MPAGRRGWARREARYRVRIFTPTQELPSAGHPTLGSWHAWMSENDCDPVLAVLALDRSGSPCALEVRGCFGVEGVTGEDPVTGA